MTPGTDPMSHATLYSAVIAATDETALDALNGWARNHLLPGVIIALGGVLIVRGVQWTERLVSQDLEERTREALDRDDVAPEQLKRSRALVRAAGWCVCVIVAIVALSFSLYVAGVPLSTLIAPATVAGVAVGFGAQQIVGDLLAGFFLLAEHQFGYGDVIRYASPGDPGGVSGTVEEMTMRVTKLRTVEGEQVIIPNSSLRQVTNLSKDWSRAVIDVPIAAGEDTSHAATVLRDASSAMAHEEPWSNLLLGDAVVTGVESVELGYFRMRVIARTLPGRQFDVARELRSRLMAALAEAGIETAKFETRPR